MTHPLKKFMQLFYTVGTKRKNPKMFVDGNICLCLQVVGHNSYL